jgi:hypothetical protein
MQSYTRLALTFLAILLLIASCNKNDAVPTACGVRDPVNNLPWLNQKIKTFQSGYGPVALYQYAYNDTNVFVFYSPVQSCLECESYGCSGNKIYWTDYRKQTEFMDKRRSKRLIWRNQ